MKKNHSVTRRALVKSSVFGLLSASLPGISYSMGIIEITDEASENPKLFSRYPSIDDEIVSEVVGASHANLERVKELVNKRPELARATWDWSFGDWETALGASSHVGRRDIAEFLMSKGARPDIFTYAMLGSYESVKAMIEATPGIQQIAGPHGITLLQHTKTGLRWKEITQQQKANGEKLLAYLESLGDADNRETNLEMSALVKEKYLGDYMYGERENDGFSVKLNMRDMLSLGKLGKFGGGLYQKSPNVFTYNGTTSVQISFEVNNDKVLSLTIHEPDLILKAQKI